MPLNKANEQQVASYLKFAKGKQRDHVDEINGAFEDTVDTKLLEDMLSQADAHRILKNLRDAVQETASKEFSVNGRISAALFQQVFRLAEAKGISLNIDMSKLSDKVKLAGIDKLGVEVKDTGKKLQSLGGGGVDIKLVEQVKPLESALLAAQKAFADSSEAAKASLKKNSELKQQAATLKAKMADVQTDQELSRGGNIAGLREQTESLQQALREEKQHDEEEALRKELAAIDAELAGKIADSSQFKTMKNIIQEKNNEIKALRAKIA